MSNLTPEKRADKNGRLVTRHVLTDKRGTPFASGVPSPATPLTPLPKTRDEYAREIVNFLLEASDDLDRDTTSKLHLKHLTLSTLRLIHERMSGMSEREGDLFLDSLDKIIAGSVNQDDTQAELESIVDALTKAMPVIAKFRGTSMSAWEAISIAKGASYGAQGNDIIFASKFKVLESSERAFRYLVWEFMITGECRKRQGSDIREDAQWLEENMDRLSDHRAMLKERGTVDRELLNEMIILNEIPALSEGLL